jgi:hypothetical protein
MTEQQAKTRINQSGKNWDDFLEWMNGQTLGLNPDGTTDYYEYDVETFCANRSPMGHG